MTSPGDLFRNDEPAHEPQETRSAKWFRWFVFGFVGILALTIIVWALSGKPPKDVPVITGAGTPDRVDPAEDPARVPHQDQPVYERLAAGTSPDRGQELLPRAEEPMTRDQLAAVVGTGQTASTPPAMTDPPAPAQQESGAAVAAVAPESPAAPATPPAAPARETEQPAADNDEAETGFRIQVASVLSREQAEAEWGRIAQRHPDLLGRLQPFYPTYDAGERGTYYQVQGGPLIDKALADLLCSQLKARKVDCFVTTP